MGGGGTGEEQQQQDQEKPLGAKESPGSQSSSSGSEAGGDTKGGKGGKGGRCTPKYNDPLRLLIYRTCTWGKCALPRLQTHVSYPDSPNIPLHTTTVMASKQQTVYPRGMTSPKVTQKVEVSFDPYQQLQFAKARAVGVEDAMEGAKERMESLAGKWVA